MTNEEKELLIKDLCARLLYGVMGVTNEGNQTPLLVNGEAEWDFLTSINYRIEKFGWRPYLRLMDSMTDEEQKEFVAFRCVSLCPIIMKSCLTIENENEMFDWLNAHHFDYHGLIKIGLAIEAPDGMYYKQNETNE